MPRRLREALARFLERDPALYALGVRLRELLEGPDPLPARPDYPGVSRYLSDYRKWQALRNRILAKDEARLRELVFVNSGAIVRFGPFAGLSFKSNRAHLSAAMMLGSYESALHPHIETAVDRRPDVVLNPGCASGYYAVGLARRLPLTRVVAWDLDVEARSRCARLAEENGVSGRVEIRGQFHGDEVEEFKGETALLVCDIDGDELVALQPDRFPTLAQFDLIAEMHEVFDPAITETIGRRFEDTHHVDVIREWDHPPNDVPPYLEPLGAIERFIALEGGLRWGPTPWTVMWTRAR